MARGRLVACWLILGASTALADAFSCEADGTATSCTDSGCYTLGACPLGCDADAGLCAVPSNVPADAFVGTGLLYLSSGSPVTISTDTGAIVDGDGGVIRAPGSGLDGPSGISFELVNQGPGASVLGVFSMDRFLVSPGVTVNVVGSLPLVILSKNPVDIGGTLDVGARGTVGGPGGADGGGPGLPGFGACGGPAAPLGTEACPHLCAAGAGGAGYAASGGTGGDVVLTMYTVNFPATAGGAVCGDPTLRPLAGGSGGAGGAIPGAYTSAVMGYTPVVPSGGGGGGAVQIVSRTQINVTGIITAPGEGAEGSISAGGASGGSGGAILLEAPSVFVSGVLAVNGGGGGGGDCT